MIEREIEKLDSDVRAAITLAGLNPIQKTVVLAVINRLIGILQSLAKGESNAR